MAHGHDSTVLGWLFGVEIADEVLENFIGSKGQGSLGSIADKRRNCSWIIIKNTSPEGPGSLFFKNLREAVSDAKIFRITQGLVDQSDFDDLERLHDKDLRPSSDSSTYKTSEKLYRITHCLMLLYGQNIKHINSVLWHFLTLKSISKIRKVFHLWAKNGRKMN